MGTQPLGDTRDEAYTERLMASVHRSSGVRRLAQRPYRRHIRSMQPGRVLDVGCGVGRNLVFLDGNGVGIDHNPTSVAVARQRGLQAYTPDEFLASADAVEGAFDSLLLAHVLEHLTPDVAETLIRDHLRFVRRGGSVIVICPQQRGQASDPTHVTEFPAPRLQTLLAHCGLRNVEVHSFPFPSWMGRVFTHNETVARGTV
jgi:2-polyprenyl-3-methyl-5-hydroxy-6-metoxy-1,4-benzoquinol methylase